MQLSAAAYHMTWAHADAALHVEGEKGMVALEGSCKGLSPFNMHLHAMSQ